MHGGCSGGIHYLHVPVVYCLWTKEKTKLEMAADAIDAVMRDLEGKHIVVLCDSWYPKKKFISKILSHELFLSRLADEASNTINSADILSVLRDMAKHWNNAA